MGDLGQVTDVFYEENKNKYDARENDSRKMIDGRCRKKKKLFLMFLIKKVKYTEEDERCRVQET